MYCMEESFFLLAPAHASQHSGLQVPALEVARIWRILRQTNFRARRPQASRNV